MHSERVAQHRRPGRAAVDPFALARVALAFLLVAALSALAGCSPAPAGAPEPGAEVTATTRTEPVPAPTNGALRARVDGRDAAEPADEAVELSEPPDHVLLVGDSVLAQVIDDLARRLPSTLHVDAADCRRIDVEVSGPCGGVPSGSTVSAGVEAAGTTMAALAAEGVTPDAAVVVLANNSELAAAELDATMEALAAVPRVWWVTTRIEGFGRQDPNNAVLAELAGRDPRAGVIDWYEHSRDQDWLGDHVHPDPSGEIALAWLIARQLRCDCAP